MESNRYIIFLTTRSDRKILKIKSNTKFLKDIDLKLIKFMKSFNLNFYYLI